VSSDVQVLLCPEKSRPQENKDKVLLGYTSMVDAWAMGILAYELIVGKPPFEKQSRAATYEHIMYRKPEFPPNMSPDAKDFVFTALTKVPRATPSHSSASAVKLHIVMKLLQYALPAILTTECLSAVCRWPFIMACVAIAGHTCFQRSTLSCDVSISWVAVQVQTASQAHAVKLCR